MIARHHPQHYVEAVAVSRGPALKITILHVGDVPAPLREEFGPYVPMFRRLFASVHAPFEFETCFISEGAPFPDLGQVQALLIPGSAAGVYDDLVWMEPLRAFIRQAYAARTPMVGAASSVVSSCCAVSSNIRAP